MEDMNFILSKLITLDKSQQIFKVKHKKKCREIKEYTTIKYFISFF